MKFLFQIHNLNAKTHKLNLKEKQWRYYPESAGKLKELPEKVISIFVCHIAKKLDVFEKAINLSDITDINNDVIKLILTYFRDFKQTEKLNRGLCN